MTRCLFTFGLWKGLDLQEEEHVLEVFSAAKPEDIVFGPPTTQSRMAPSWRPFAG
jgi:hypothetical protein